MKKKNANIEDFVTTEIKRIKRKRPFIEDVELVYEQANRGSFISMVRAKTKNKVIVLKEESRCLKSSVRKIFTNLTRLMKKKKYNKGARHSVKFNEVTL